MMGDVNLLAVLLAAVAQMALGFLWYSPVLFGNPWMKLMGMTKDSMTKAKSKGMQKTYMVSMLAALVTAYVLANVMGMLGTVGLPDAWQTAFWLWLGFVGPVQLTDVLFNNKSMNLYAINTGYQLAGLLAMATVLALWV